MHDHGLAENSKSAPLQIPKLDSTESEPINDNIVQTAGSLGDVPDRPTIADLVTELHQLQIIDQRLASQATTIGIQRQRNISRMKNVRLAALSLVSNAELDTLLNAHASDHPASPLGAQPASSPRERRRPLVPIELANLVTLAAAARSRSSKELPVRIAEEKMIHGHGRRDYTRGIAFSTGGGFIRKGGNTTWRLLAWQIGWLCERDGIIDSQLARVSGVNTRPPGLERRKSRATEPDVDPESTEAVSASDDC